MKVSHKCMLRKRKKLQEKRKFIASSQIKVLQTLISPETIQQICNKHSYYFRTRLLPPFITIFHMLQAAVNPEATFRSAWNSIGEVCSYGSLSKARKRLPTKIWQNLHSWVVEKITTDYSFQDQWRGHRVIGIDGTCVSMSDEEELTKVFGKPGSKHGPGRFPVARIVFAFTLKSMISITHQVDAYKVGENRLFASLIKSLNPGDIIVGDRRYAGAKLYIDYMRSGIDFITRKHASLKVEFMEIIEKFGKNDYLVKMPVGKKYRREDETLPKSISVRIIKATVRIRGKKEEIWIVSSLLDPRKYPATEIRILHKKRWKVEGLIEEIKLNLGADILRSKTAEGIHKEIYARVIAFNLIHWMILNASKKHKKDPGRISVVTTIRLTVSYSLMIAVATVKKARALYKKLLNRIAHAKVPYRPGRIEPRLKKREQKHYSKLKISRSKWRELYAGTA